MEVNTDNILEAFECIPLEFKNSPQYISPSLSSNLGCQVILKIESLNSLRSFKGRGTSYAIQTLLRQRLEESGGAGDMTQASPGRPGLHLVTASAGNFGQGFALAASRAGIACTVFAATSANAAKVARMRSFGATVVLEGLDFDEAKEAARRFVARQEESQNSHTNKNKSASGSHNMQGPSPGPGKTAQGLGDKFVFMEDGADPSIAEGAGTIAKELVDQYGESIDTIFVPVGNGALILGVGAYFKKYSPKTKVVGVCPETAPAMALSWETRDVVTTSSCQTLADGAAVRVPVPSTIPLMCEVVDEFELVSEQEILSEMRAAMLEEGLVIEGAAALGLAALRKRSSDRNDGVSRKPNECERQVDGSRVAVVVTGSNANVEEVIRGH